MAVNSVRSVLLGLVAIGALSACVETGGTTGGNGDGSATATRTARAGAEVEAPDVFQVSDSALWDGRPSLGGIWVASPDAKDPERVVMFNPATGKSVKGALFRRERDNPGPRLQLSSDAAEALGVLAGMPTDIQVTALRKVEVEEEPAPVAEEPAAEAAAATEPTAEEPDAAKVAAAALDAVDAGAAVDGADPAVATAGEEPAKPKTWKEKREEAKAAREAKKAEEAAAKAAAEAAEAGEAEVPVTAGAVAGSQIDAAPLDAGNAETAAKASASEAVEKTEPAPAATGGASRTIQIGSFSKEENAKRAVDALSKIDIAAEVKKIEKDGKIFWSVVAKGDKALLQKIKDAGFADAYFLK